MNLLNYLIKNETVYVGNILLKIEKHPNYINGSLLNKIHLNLGFFKIVSRVVPEYDINKNKVLDAQKCKLIEKYTMGQIKNIDGKQCFVSLDDKYVGSPEVGWRYYNENLIVCMDRPYGLAVKLIERKKVKPFISIKSVYKNYMKQQLNDNNVVGYLVYSHKEGTLFRIGDRIFDQYYTPKESDYEPWEWCGYLLECEDKNDSYNNVGNYIPFNRFGDKEIKNFNQALSSAINLNEYLN